MNKAEFVQAIADKAGLKKTDAVKFVKSMLDVVTDALKAGDKVGLTGFGTFSVAERPARSGRNPQTGKAIKIAAARVPKFKAGAGLKGAVNAAKGKKKKK